MCPCQLFVFFLSLLLVVSVSAIFLSLSLTLSLGRSHTCANILSSSSSSSANCPFTGGFFATELPDWDWLLQVNLYGTIHGVRAFAPHLRARRAGAIVNVASASGYCNLPSLSAYGTTKYAVVGLSEALRAELLPDGVTVGVVCPGFVNSEILASARIRGAPDADAERRRLQDFYRRKGHAPETVAKAIVSAAKSGKAMVPVNSEAWLLYVMTRVAPSVLPWLLRASPRLYRK